mmetsp:Transcript_82803/g.165612  ORF Transcript_82803/g.165612 Transcript_82803/m.165612 type:complete len:80 (+) Transcript_82803:168-407(+)
MRVASFLVSPSLAIPKVAKERPRASKRRGSKETPAVRLKPPLALSVRSGVLVLGNGGAAGPVSRQHQGASSRCRSAGLD